MARCNCNGQTCGCRIIAGAGVTVAGSGTAQDPWVVSAAGGGGDDGWFPGDLKDTARADTPAGWLEANGQAVSRTAYAALFAEVGTQWGAGDGFSTFNVPDFRGRTRVGVGPGYALASTGGAATVTLLTAQLPAHVHSIAHVHAVGNHTHVQSSHTHPIDHNHGATDGAGDHAHGVNYSTASVTAGGAGTRVVSVGSGGSVAFTSVSGAHLHAIPPYFGASGAGGVVNTQGMVAGVNTGASSAANSGSTGAGDPVSVMSPYAAVRVLVHT